MKPNRFLVSRSLLGSGISLCFAASFSGGPVVQAAPIIWRAPTTISADSDIQTMGGLVYAYNASNTNQTVNGVTFTGVSSQTAWGTGLSLTLAASPGNNVTAFDDGGWGNFGGGAAYKAMLAGASYNGGAAATLTLNTLTSGHRYLSQFWVNDTRATGSGRIETATSTGGNTITLDFNDTNAAGGLGQFAIGVFPANSTTQAFTLDGNASSQINAIQLRDVTNLGNWVGTGGTTWDSSTTANFASNLWDAALVATTFNVASSTLDGVVFADNYWNSGVATAVTQNSVTIADGGVSTGNVFFENSSALSYTISSPDTNGITGGTRVNVTGGGSVILEGTHSYSGGTHIGSGTLQIGNAGLTGTMGSGAISNSGTLVFNRTNSYSLAAGNLVTGAGAVTLANTGAVATSVDNQFNTTGTLNIGASNGSTTVSSLDLGNGGSSFGSLNVITNSTSANTITVGAGRTLNISGAVSIGASSGTTNLTLTGASGTLAINNGGGATNNNFYIGGGGTATGTLNMSGLGTFNANLGTGTFAVGNGSTNGSGSFPFTAILSANSTLSATKVSVGGGFGNTTNASAYTLRLGSGTNTINTTDLYVGVFNNQGRGNVGTTLIFNTTTGTLTLRGLTGGSSRANVHIGENQGGSTGTASGGKFDLGGSASTGLSGGNADLLINNLIISRRTAGSNDTSSMTFRSGVLDVNALTMGNSTGGNSATSTLTLNGGSVIFNTAVTLGLASSTGTGNATMNIAGATVISTPGLVMGNRTSGTVNSTVNLSAGSLTLGGAITTVGETNTTLTLSGGTLDLGGNNIGTALAAIDTFTINPATAAELKNVGTINGTAGITKAGVGVLTLNANSYSGPTAINAGTLLIDGADDLGDGSATNTISLNGSTLRSTANSYDLGINRAITLAGAGTIQADAGTLTVSGDVTSGANGLILVGDGNIAMTGVIGTGASPTGGLTIGSSTVGANVTLSANNLFTGSVAFGGTNVQPQGKLTLTHSGALGVGPKTVTATSSTGATGGIHLQNNITLASNISFTTSGFALYNDSGNNTVNGNVTMAAGNGNTVITSNSGLLTLNGDFTANTTIRNLLLLGNGDGILNGDVSNGATAALEIRKSSGTGTWTLTGTNTNTGPTTVAAGKLVVSGSLGASNVTVQNNATLGGNGNLGGNLTIESGGRHALAVAATSGTQVTRAIAGSLTLTPGHILDLSAATTPAPGTYILATAAGGITGTLGTVNLTGLTGSVAINGNNLELTVAAPSGFASWIGGFGLALADRDPADDPDNDGLSNLLEFVLNGTPSVSDASILPDLAVTATDFEFTYQRRDDSVSPETTQTFQWGSTLASWPGSVVVTAGGGSFPPATITISPGTPDDGVTDTVKVSIPKSEAVGGKLFGRILVNRP
jgi:autotransporter-associated beta strand protein